VLLWLVLSDTLLHPLAKSLADNVAATLSKPSVSAGVGLIYRLDPIRIEVNFGVPLVASRSDGYRRGFQVGMGMDFL
jgi:outer membrane protein insertion porin family